MPATYADGYADAMQGVEPQSDEPEYITGFNSLQEEVESGFADLQAMFETPGAKNEFVYKNPTSSP